MVNKGGRKKIKLLKGGEGDGVSWDMNKMSLYYAMIIMGYFGCKILMGFYKVYSKKLHYLKRNYWQHTSK